MAAFSRRSTPRCLRTSLTPGLPPLTWMMICAALPAFGSSRKRIAASMHWSAPFFCLTGRAPPLDLKPVLLGQNVRVAWCDGFADGDDLYLVVVGIGRNRFAAGNRPTAAPARRANCQMPTAPVASAFETTLLAGAGTFSLGLTATAPVG